MLKKYLLKVKDNTTTYTVRGHQLDDMMEVVTIFEDNFKVKVEQITAPDGRIYKWDLFLFHQYFAKGRISEKEFLQEVLIKEKGGSE